MLSSVVLGAFPASASQFFVEGAAYLASPGYTATDATGNTSLTRPVSAIFGPRWSVPLAETLDLELGLRHVLPWRRNIDGNQRYYTTLFNFDLGYRLSESWQVRAGVGFQWTYIRGDAATVTQRNGTSSSSFYVPAVSQSVWQGGLDLGASFYVTSELRVTLDAAIWEVASKERRRASVLLGLDYALF